MLTIPVKYYIYIGIFAVFAFLVWKVYSNNAELERVRLEAQKNEQNLQATKDLAKVRADSITVLAVFVQRLNDSNIAKDRLILALRTENQLFLDSIVVLNERGDTVLIQDSTVTVPFRGSKGIVDYAGNTVANIHTNQSTYRLNLSFPRPVELTSEIFRDPTDNLWKVRSISRTPGVSVKGVSTIDNEIWQEIESQLKPETIPDYFAFGAMITQDANGTVRPYAGIGIKPKNYEILIQYNLSKYENQDVPWQKRVSLGFYYFIR